MRLLLVILALSVSLPTAASARSVDAGSVWVGAGLGPGFKLGSRLGGGGFYALMSAQGEYALDKTFGIVGDLQLGNLGFIGTSPLRLRAGARYRMTGLDLPVAPYGEVKLGIGRIYGVINANIGWLGLHFAIGADYFLTAKLAVGGHLGLDLGSTYGTESNSFYGTVEVIATASYALFGDSPPPVEAGEASEDPAPVPADAFGFSL